MSKENHSTEEREVVLTEDDVCGQIIIGFADTRYPRCWVLAEVGSSNAASQGLIHRNDILLEIDGKDPPESEISEVCEMLVDCSCRPKGVKVKVRPPTANDYMNNRLIPQELVKLFLGDKFAFTKDKDTGKYKWTGEKAATIYKALLFCNNCTAIWWVHHQTLWGDPRADKQTCPGCGTCEEGGVDIVLHAAPNL